MSVVTECDQRSENVLLRILDVTPVVCLALFILI
jgi:hypothetical protein